MESVQKSQNVIFDNLLTQNEKIFDAEDEKLCLELVSKVRQHSSKGSNKK